MNRLLSVVGLLLTAFCLLVLLAIGVAAFLLHGPQFTDWRRNIAADILADILNQEVTVTGRVSVDLAPQTTVSITGVEMIHPLRPDKIQSIHSASFSFPTWSALTGKFEVTSFVLEGARIAFFLEDEENQGSQPDALEVAGQTISGFLNNPISDHFSLQNVTFIISDPENGWDEEIVINQLSFLEDPTGENIDIRGGGSFNRFVLLLEGRVGRSPQSAAPRPFELTFSFPGSTTHVSGSVDTSQAVTAIDWRVESISASLGDLLDVLELERALEGTGYLNAQVSGPMNGLTVRNIEAAATGQEAGKGVELSGSIRDLNRAEGIDLKFRATVVADDETPTSSSIVDIRIQGFSGELSGDLGRIVLEQFNLRTNIASAELAEIGPISIDRITKDEIGRLGFYGIRILDGPPERRTLNIAGDFTDVLQLAGISLNGDLDIPTVDFLGVETPGDRDLLGRIIGQLSISDANGTLGMETLDVKIVGSDLVALSILAQIDQFRTLDDLTLEVDLDIGNFARFASYFGGSTTLKGALRFDGRASLNDETPRIEGNITIGRTQLTGNLFSEVRGHRPFLAGTIRSNLVYVDDIRGVVDAVGIMGFDETKNVELQDDFANEFGTDLDIEVRRIAGSGKSVGKISGRLVYDDQIANIDPFRASFVGGRVIAAVTIDMRDSVPRIRANGRINNIPIGKVLSEFGAPPVVSGFLTTKVDIFGRGSDMAQIARSLSGSVTASLYDGTFNTDLIDLSGLNTVTWLFTRSGSKTVKIVCTLVPFSFTNGRGLTNKTVIETENVQIIGSGSLDFRQETIDLRFQPIPKRQQLVDIVTAFGVSGKLTSPDISIDNTGARIAAEIVALPFNFFGLLLTGGGPKPSQSKPCVIPVPN